MTTKISFPEHMRRLEAGLNALAGKTGTGSVMVRRMEVGHEVGEPVFKYGMVGGDPPAAGVGHTMNDAAISLLHHLAGTEPPPF